jgi:glycosyltransferase involved in cell wall biosynthesis
VLVFHIITGLKDGGAEAVLYRLCLHDKEHRHIVVSLLDEGKYGPLLSAHGVSVFALKMHSPFDFFIGFIRLILLIFSRKPDVIQTWLYHADLFGGLAARLAGAKVICWGVHNFALHPNKSKTSTLFIVRISAILSRWLPLRIVVCARSAVRSHEALGYARDKMKLIPNGYELSKFYKMPQTGSSIRLSLGIPDFSLLIGTVARYDPQKDHENLFRSISILKARGVAFQCVLAGDGMDQKNTLLVNLIRELDLGGIITLLGPRGDIPELMSALDIHVLSSCSEAFPNVVAEAMACETPCVVTDVGDAAEIVGNTGWVVPPRNAAALADAIELALTMCRQPEWATRCVAARQRIRLNFSVEKMILSYSELWADLTRH